MENKKRSIYCNDEEFSFAKYLIDMMRMAGKGQYVSTRLLTLNGNCVVLTTRKGLPEDTII